MSYAAKVTAPIIVGGDKDNWCQTLISHDLFVAISVLAPEAYVMGKKFIDKLSEEFAEKPQTLKNFKIRLQVLSAQFPQVDYTIGILTNESILLGVEGNGAVFINRDNRAGLLQAHQGVMIGKLKPNDIFLLVAHNWWELLNKSIIFNSLKMNHPDEIAEDLTLQLHQHAQNHQAAGLILQLEKTDTKPQDINFAVHTNLYREKIRNIFDQIKNKLAGFQFRIKPIFWLISGLVLLLVGSIIWGVIQANQKQTQVNLSDKLQQINHQVEEGLNLIELNPLRARELLQQAVKDLNAESQKPYTQAQALLISQSLTKAQIGLDQAMQKYDVSLELFFDLNLIKKGAGANKLFLSEEILVILDKSNLSIYSLNIKNKSYKILVGDEKIGQAISAVGNGQEFYMLADAIYQIQAGKLVEIIKNDQNWGNLVDAYFYGGNLYLLDTGNSRIWKYIRTESGFSDRREYLNIDTQVNLANTKKLTINGSVWVSGNDKIYKFTQGVKDNWEIQGLTGNLGEKLLVYVSDATKNMYILDNQRIIIVDKDGIYLSEYVFKDQLSISDLVVSEISGKILLLSGDKIYGIELKK